MKEVHTLARALTRIYFATAYVHVSECAFVYALPRLKHNITPHFAVDNAEASFFLSLFLLWNQSKTKILTTFNATQWPFVMLRFIHFNLSISLFVRLALPIAIHFKCFALANGERERKSVEDNKMLYNHGNKMPHNIHTRSSITH